jgi:hypothetical protein
MIIKVNVREAGCEEGNLMELALLLVVLNLRVLLEECHLATEMR